MNSLGFEKYYPYIFAICGVVAWYFLGQPFPKDVKEFFGAALGLSGTLVGFLATAQSILMALPSDSVMGALKRSGYIDPLTRYMREAFYSLGVFAILNLGGFFLDLNTQPLPLWYRLAWVGLGAIGLITFQRVIEIILRIMRRR